MLECSSWINFKVDLVIRQLLECRLPSEKLFNSEVGNYL